MSKTPLSEVPTAEENSAQLVPEYFLSEVGRDELQEFLNITLPDTNDIDIVSEELRKIPEAVLDEPENKKKLQSLEGKSLNYLKDLYANMALGQEADREIDTVTLVKNPEKLLDKIKGLQHNRQFIRQVRSDLRDGDDGDKLTTAKLMITDIYRDKINANLAALYPSLVNLVRQYEAAGQDVKLLDTDEINMMLKVVKAAESSTDIQDQFLRMLDYIRNGAAISDDGKFTPIDEQIFSDVEAINSESTDKNAAYFSKEQIAEFEQYFVDSSQMKALIDVYLQKIGLDQEGWVSEIRQDTNSFAVSAIQQIIKIPAKFNSTIAPKKSAAGVAGLMEHEIGGKEFGHVMQSVNAALNPSLLEIAKSPKFRGKRNGSLREAGGTHAEADSAKRYFGIIRRSTSSYAVAMRTLLDGGSHAEAVQSFAQSHLQGDESQAVVKKTYKLAADRVMRLLRFGGRNSQPLHYTEAATVRRVAEDMPKEVVDTMFAEAVFDPVDMIRLHQFGMLDTSSQHRFKPEESPEATLTSLLEELIQDRI